MKLIINNDEVLKVSALTNAEVAQSLEYTLIKSKVIDAWNAGRFLAFEDGISNQFTDKLDALIENEDLELLTIAIKEMAEQDTSSDVVTFFALKKIGSLWDPRLKKFQLEVLKKTIENQNALIREGAVLGLELLGNKESRQILSSHLLIETDERIKKIITTSKATKHWIK